MPGSPAQLGIVPRSLGQGRQHDHGADSIASGNGDAHQFGQHRRQHDGGADRQPDRRGDGDGAHQAGEGRASSQARSLSVGPFHLSNEYDLAMRGHLRRIERPELEARRLPECSGGPVYLAANRPAHHKRAVRKRGKYFRNRGSSFALSSLALVISRAPIIFMNYPVGSTAVSNRAGLGLALLILVNDF